VNTVSSFQIHLHHIKEVTFFGEKVIYLFNKAGPSISLYIYIIIYIFIYNITRLLASLVNKFWFCRKVGLKGSLFGAEHCEHAPRQFKGYLV